MAHDLRYMTALTVNWRCLTDIVRADNDVDAAQPVTVEAVRGGEHQPRGDKNSSTELPSEQIICWRRRVDEHRDRAGTQRLDPLNRRRRVASDACRGKKRPDKP